MFDVTKISDGDALWQTTSWMQGYAEGEGATDADLNAVLVFRHAAVTMVLNDAMWARLAVASGKREPTSIAKRNPYLGDGIFCVAGAQEAGCSLFMPG